MEKDDELKGEGNSLDFGARIYDPRIGRFLSVDPLASSFPMNSAYLYAKNSPLFFIDEEGKSGKAYKEKDENGRNVIRIVSNVFIYGKYASQKLADNLQSQSMTQWNNNGENFEFTDDNGEIFIVKFEIKVQAISEKAAIEGIREENVENNFYLVGENMGNSYTLSSDNPKYPGGNTGYLSFEQIAEGINNFSHEQNHGFAGLSHISNPKNEDGNPRIYLHSDQKRFSDGTIINLSLREVSNEDVNVIISKINFDSKSTGKVGDVRKQKAIGNEKSEDL